MPRLLVLTGPIAAGKNTVATRLTGLLTSAGRTVIVADVDDIAAMVGPPGAGVAGLWFAAHEAHGALVARWLRTDVDHVIAVGPFWTIEERAALTADLPHTVSAGPRGGAAVSAQADPGRVLSRDPGFHTRAHRRFREHQPTIPADLTFDSVELSADQIATAIADRLGG